MWETPHYWGITEVDKILVPSYVKSFCLSVVYFWGFYDIKFKLTQYKSKLGLIPQYT